MSSIHPRPIGTTPTAFYTLEYSQSDSLAGRASSLGGIDDVPDKGCADYADLVTDDFFSSQSLVSQHNDYTRGFHVTDQEYHYPQYVCPSELTLPQSWKAPSTVAQSSLHRYNHESAFRYSNSTDASLEHNAQEAAVITCDDSQSSGLYDFDLPRQGQQMADINYGVPAYRPTQLAPATQDSENPSGSQLNQRQGRLQPIRAWLLGHTAWPYPTRKEKAELAIASGYSEYQINVCLRNLRAREKNLSNGSTRTRRKSGSTDVRPSEVSPPSASPNWQAFDDPDHPTSLSTTGLTPATQSSDDGWWSSSSATGYSVASDNASRKYESYQASVMDYIEEDPGESLASIETALPGRKGKRHHTQRFQSDNKTQLPTQKSPDAASSDANSTVFRYPCTVCLMSFKTGGSWRRHESSVHGYSDRQWTCMLTDAFMNESKCIFCSEQVDSVEHFYEHGIASCLGKCASDRTFPRKDYLKQHILNAHLAGASDSVKKQFKVPQDWLNRADASLSGHDSFWCGFCEVVFETTNARMDHVAKHFRLGQGMTKWVPRPPQSSI